MEWIAFARVLLTSDHRSKCFWRSCDTRASSHGVIAGRGAKATRAVAIQRFVRSLDYFVAALLSMNPLLSH